MNATVRLDTAALEGFLAELKEVVLRRGALPEFRQFFVDIGDALDGGFETVRLDGDLFSANAGELRLSLQPGKRLLELFAALRAFDSHFGIELAHGRPLSC